MALAAASLFGMSLAGAPAGEAHARDTKGSAHEATHVIQQGAAKRKVNDGKINAADPARQKRQRHDATMNSVRNVKARARH